MTSLSSLLARIESATGPDRVLDALIWIALSPEEMRGYGFYGWRGILPKGSVDRPETELHFEYARRKAPAFTASIDTAIALCEHVLPGKIIKIAHFPSDPDKDGEATATAELRTPAHYGSHQVSFGGSATPALALCAAIIKARMET